MLFVKKFLPIDFYGDAASLFYHIRGDAALRTVRKYRACDDEAPYFGIAYGCFSTEIRRQFFSQKLVETGSFIGDKKNRFHRRAAFMRMSALQKRDAQVGAVFNHFFRPNAHLRFADVRFFEQKHTQARLPDTASERLQQFAF